MRVVEIAPIIGSGSVGRIVDEIYKGLINDNHECKVVCGKVGNTCIPKTDYLVTNTSFSRKANAAVARLLDNDGFCPFVPMKKVLKYIEDYNPDLIHMHGAYGYYINIEPLYSLIKQKNYKIVSTLHSCWDYTGHCCYYSYVDCDRWKTGCYKCQQKHAYPGSYLIDGSIRNYHKKRDLFSGIYNHVIVTPSQWLAEEIQSSFLQNYRVNIINNGIDLRTFYQIQKGDITCYHKYCIPDDKPIILGVAGVWDRRKGLEDFIELNEVSSDDVQIVIVGLSKGQIDKLPSRIIGLSKTESVRELAELYSLATILFNPTYEDNYPTVNLEAIACGTPVITYRSGGSGEALEKYEMGKVIEYKDYKEVLNLAVRYFRRDSTTPEFATKYNNIELDSSRMVRNYIKLFNSMLLET